MKAPAASAIIFFAALRSFALATVSFKIVRDPDAPNLSLSARAAPISELLFNNQSSEAYLAQVSVVDQTASSSYQVVAQGGFSAGFGGGDSAAGDYITDDFTIGGATIKGLQMGLANTSTAAYGLIGLGYDANEGPIINKHTSFVYPSIIDEMVSQGLINTKAYSLYLDSLAATTGSIIFGGLDSDKFHGNLVQLPILSSTLGNGTTAFTQLQVAMTSVGVGSQSFTPATYQASVVLDSGTTFPLLPKELVAGLVTAVKGVDDTQNSGFIFVDCNVLSNSSFTVDFGFGGANGVVIHVPASELVATAATYLGDKTLPAATSSFSQVCLLTLQFTNGTTYLVGDAILRSAYVVYDLQNNFIGLAQTNFNSTTSNIVDFVAGEVSIPTVTGTASTSTTVRASASATKSKNAGVASVPAFNIQRLLVLGIWVGLATLGGGWFLAA